MYRLISILLICGGLYADTITRDSAIAFVLREEGVYDTLQGVIYRYGLSDKYYPHIRTKGDAIKEYRNIWILSGAEEIKDNTMAFIYFDTAILFNEETGQELLRTCDYSWTQFLLLRLKKHYNNCRKYPWLKQHWSGYVGRVIRLFDKFNDKQEEK